MEKNGIKLLIVLAVFGVIAYVVSPVLNIYGALEKIDLNLVSILLALNFLFLLSSGLIMKTVLHHFDVHLSYSRCVGITALTSVGNNLIPYSGTIGKAAYLKNKHDFTYPAFMASMSAVQILNFALVSSSGFFIILISTVVIPDIWRKPVLLSFAFVGLTSISLIAFPLNLQNHHGRISRVASNVAAGWKTFRGNKGSIIKICALLFMAYLLGAIEQIVGFGVFSIKISMMQALFLEAIAIITFIIKITPGNLGVQEIVVATTSYLMGLGFEEGLVVATTLRVSGLIVITLTGGVLSPLMLKGCETLSKESAAD